MTSRRFEIASVLAGATAATVWEHVTSWEGVNAELAPIAMSHPPEYPDIASIPADGRVHLVSTLSVFGIPFDRHHLALQAVEPGRGFHECSSNRSR